MSEPTPDIRTALRISFLLEPFVFLLFKLAGAFCVDELSACITGDVVNGTDGKLIRLLVDPILFDVEAVEGAVRPISDVDELMADANLVFSGVEEAGGVIGNAVDVAEFAKFSCSVVTELHFIHEDVARLDTTETERKIIVAFYWFHTDDILFSVLVPQSL